MVNKLGKVINLYSSHTNYIQFKFGGNVNTKEQAFSGQVFGKVNVNQRILAIWDENSAIKQHALNISLEHNNQTKVSGGTSNEICATSP